MIVRHTGRDKMIIKNGIKQIRLAASPYTRDNFDKAVLLTCYQSVEVYVPADLHALPSG